MKNTTATQAIEFLVELKKEVNPAVGEELDAIVEVLREDQEEIRRLKEKKDEEKKSTQNATLPSADAFEYHSPLFEKSSRSPYRLHRPDGRRHEEADSGPEADAPAADGPSGEDEQPEKGEWKGVKQ